MFKGFGKLLRGPSSRDVTLEVIGLVKGTRKLHGGHGNCLASEDVGRIIKRAESTLKREQGTLHPDVERLLKTAVETFKAPATMKSSQDTGEWVTGMDGIHAVQEPSPAWQRSFEQAQQKLDALATRVYSHQFAPALRAEIAGMDDKQLAQKTKDDPAAMALLDGHLRKPPARAMGG